MFYNWELSGGARPVEVFGEHETDWRVMAATRTCYLLFLSANRYLAGLPLINKSMTGVVDGLQCPL